jgi:lipopolysaccharide heptosyltransferase II
VIRLGAVGDVVRALAAVGLLRRERPDVHVGWLVEEPSRALLETNPAVDEVYVFERHGWGAARGMAQRSAWLAAQADLRRRLRAARFGAALDLQGSLKSALWAIASGVPRRVGFSRDLAREGSWLLGGERVWIPAEARSRLQQFAALVRALGVGAVLPPDGRPVPLPDLTPRREAAARWVAERGFDRKPWVLLCPGSSRRQQFKRWPAGRFAELGRRLAARGVGVAIGWGPGEETLADEVESGCLGGASLAPAGDLLHMAALISHAGVFVGNDSGPMHLAWAVGTPVVGIFGPTDPELNAPPGGTCRVLYEGPPRRMGERRPRQPVYLDRVRAEEVEAAVMAALERTGVSR